MNKSFAFDRVKSRASGLSALAMTMALPHENKAQRLPVLPVTLTSTVELMSDRTLAITTQKRAALCRDVAYPLWVDYLVSGAGQYLQAERQFTVPNTANVNLGLPEWNYVHADAGAATTLDGVAATAAAIADLMPVGQRGGDLCVYSPSGPQFTISIESASNQTGSTMVADLSYYYLGEWKPTTLGMAGHTTGWRFTGTPGTTTTSTGQLFDGNVPIGWVKLRNLRTGVVAPVAESNPKLFMGWATGNFAPGTLSPSGEAVILLPAFPPVEFANSVIPYSGARTTASAALFTNVTAVLNKEGTVLAARLKNELVEMWGFGSAQINTVHPRLRYYGPLEKGLYTFTTPTSQDGKLQDYWTLINCGINGSLYPNSRPIFRFDQIDVYNAIVFTDLGNVSTGTNLAMSLYNHLEFESTSSLFSPGSSTYTMEQLHAAEVALQQFGHFHENPLHWAAIRSAAAAALRIVGPMVAPYVQRAGSALVNKGVAYLRGTKAPGDRDMNQSTAVVVRKQPRTPAKPKPKAKARQPSKKR